MLAHLPARLVALGLGLAGALGCQRSERTDESPASSSSAGKDAAEKAWMYGPCEPSPGLVAEEVWNAGENAPGFSIVALDDAIYIGSEYGILRENGEIFIPLVTYPSSLAASDGYLYWTERARDPHRRILYASLGSLPSPRPLATLDEYAPYDLQPAPHGVVATADAIQRLTLYSQAGPPRALENCRLREPSNSIVRVASAENALVWDNLNSAGQPPCAIINGTLSEFPSATRMDTFAIDSQSVYYSITPNSDSPPSFVYKRSFLGAEATLVASAGQIVGMALYGEHIYWHTWPGRLERALKDGKDNQGRETLACDIFDFAMTKVFVYWVTNHDHGPRRLMRARR